MKRTLPALLVLLALLPLSGCLVYSQSPFYEIKDLVTDPNLSGLLKSKDKNSKSVVTFKLRADKTYLIKQVEDGKTTKYVAGVFKLKDWYFMDGAPVSGEGMESLHSAHFIFRLHLKGKEIWTMDNLNEDWVKDRLMKGQLKLAHAEFQAKPIKDKPGEYDYGTDDLILTASTKELQDFIVSVANEENAWDIGTPDDESPNSKAAK